MRIFYDVVGNCIEGMIVFGLGGKWGYFKGFLE